MLQAGDMLYMPLHTFIYRGEGTVFASAGDAKHRRKGHDLIVLDCINDYHSYNWRKRITYIMRFKDDCIPRCYRNKEGEVVENPMYTALERGESPWTGKLSPTQRKEAGLEPVTFLLGEEAVAALNEKGLDTAASEDTETADGSAAAESSQTADGSTPAATDTGTETAALPAPITGDIVAVMPTAEETEDLPRMAGGKPYGSRPSTGKKLKKKSRKSHKKKKAARTENDGSGGKSEE
jgi:hypothetical protein